MKFPSQFISGDPTPILPPSPSPPPPAVPSQLFFNSLMWSSLSLQTSLIQANLISLALARVGCGAAHLSMLSRPALWRVLGQEVEPSASQEVALRPVLPQ